MEQLHMWKRMWLTEDGKVGPMVVAERSDGRFFFVGLDIRHAVADENVLRSRKRFAAAVYGISAAFDILNRFTGEEGTEYWCDIFGEIPADEIPFERPQEPKTS